MNTAIEIKGLSKTYAGGFQALNSIDLSIHSGEIFALLGPNGAGKSTLIGIICGLINPTAGRIYVGGYCHHEQYREARDLIGLVPQELCTDTFEKVWDTVCFSRGVFNKPKNPDYIEKVLKDLSLWEKRHNRILELSGGMKRRVMIAKALAHEPRILFLDEPTAGVDVELRRGMWQQIHQLRQQGVTVILTTHYIEEAEEMADRVGVINKGQIIEVEAKDTLMKKLGSKKLTIDLKTPLATLPEALKTLGVESQSHNQLAYTYDPHQSETKFPEIFACLAEHGIGIEDLHARQSSLEEIFVNLVHSGSEGRI